MLVQELEPIEREILVKAAILAPSMHNTQPWRFRFRRRTVEVHRDRSRELLVEDPDGRMTMIGHGAAIFNLRVAAASLGRKTTVTVFPDPDQPDLVAAVTIEALTSEFADPAVLFPYLARRRTNRQPFADRAIPTTVRLELARAALREGAMLEWVDDAARTRWLLDLASAAAIAEADQPERFVEREQWVGGERAADGVPSAVLGPRPADPPAPVADLGVAPADRLRPQETFERQPILAVVWTRRDDPPGWLVAGQALQRVLLVATTHGLAASLLNQPFEHKDLRWMVRDPRAGWHEPQVVARFGYGPEVPATPRRQVEEFIMPDGVPDDGGANDQGG